MEAIKYVRGQLKPHGSLSTALNRAKQTGAISDDTEKTTRLAIEKICDAAEMLAAENAQLKRELSQLQQPKLF